MPFITPFFLFTFSFDLVWLSSSLFYSCSAISSAKWKTLLEKKVCSLFIAIKTWELHRQTNTGKADKNIETAVEFRGTEESQMVEWVQWSKRVFSIYFFYSVICESGQWNGEVKSATVNDWKELTKLKREKKAQQSSKRVWFRTSITIHRFTSTVAKKKNKKVNENKREKYWPIAAEVLNRGKKTFVLFLLHVW